MKRTDYESYRDELADFLFDVSGKFRGDDIGSFYTNKDEMVTSFESFTKDGRLMSVSVAIR